MCYYVYVWCIVWDLYFHRLEILVCNVWHFWIFKLLWVNEYVYKEIFEKKKTCNAVMYMDSGRLFDTLACSRGLSFFCFSCLSLCVEAQGEKVWMCESPAETRFKQTCSNCLWGGTMTLTCRTAVLCQHNKNVSVLNDVSLSCLFVVVNVGN